MSAKNPELARLAELAVERWLEGLQPPESVEFERLRARYPDFDVESQADVSAALQISVAGGLETLPDRLGLLIANGADGYFGPSPSGIAMNDLERVAAIDRRRSWLTYGGWLTAAASLLLSLSLWRRDPVPAEIAKVTSPPSTASANRESQLGSSIAAGNGQTGTALLESRTPASARAEPVDSATERAQFIRTHSWLFQRPLLPGPDPTGEAVSGDVVWDAKSQTGYLNFHRLRRNNPNVEQYQLWIFDAQRDQRFPVDGGVFDVIDASGDEVVRFTARLKVEVPLMFAVTVERRGGVVVSDRSRIAAVAHSS
jgi:hypothetical protein